MNTTTGSDTSCLQWFALVTRYKHEKKVDMLLHENGFTSYLPLISSVRKWSDRKKKVKLPLFSCYLFVNMDIRKKTHVLQTEGLVRFVSFENKPAVIPDYQIQVIRLLLNGQRKIESTTDFMEGQPVKVESGPLRGLYGTFVKSKTESRLLIHVDYIHQSMLVEIDADEIVPSGSNKSSHIQNPIWRN